MSFMLSVVMLSVIILNTMAPLGLGFLQKLQEEKGFVAFTPKENFLLMVIEKLVRLFVVEKLEKMGFIAFNISFFS